MEEQTVEALIKVVGDEPMPEAVADDAMAGIRSGDMVRLIFTRFENLPRADTSPLISRVEPTMELLSPQNRRFVPAILVLVPERRSINKKRRCMRSEAKLNYII